MTMLNASQLFDIVKIVPLRELQSFPSQGSALSGGLDLCWNPDSPFPASTLLRPHSSFVFATGVALHIDHPPIHICGIPFLLQGFVWPRSGLSVKHNIETGAGLIDNDYKGEIKIHLYNHSDEFVEIKAGEKIAQIAFSLCLDLSVVIKSEVIHKERGDKGFGSTGR